jgi:hypothetical protein
MATLNNPHDNSENLVLQNKKDLYSISSTGTDGELEDHIRYYKYLKMRSEIEGGDGTKLKINGGDVEIKDLLPPNSEFEDERLRVLVLLNKLGPDDAIVSQLQRDFGTNSLFELASEYANYSLGRSRGERLYAILHGKGTKEANDESLYESLKAGGEKRAKAKSDLSAGEFRAGYKSSRVL